MELIDKSALIAEIEKVADEPAPSHDQQCPWEDGYYCGLYKVMIILDTLEVKEVKEQSVSKDLEEAIGQSFIYHENHGDDFRSDKQIETAYRYGFEDGVKYKEKQNLEVKEVNLDEIANHEDIKNAFKAGYELGMSVSNKAQKG